MSITVMRPGATNDKMPAYLKDNLTTLEDFSKKLDGISQEIRAIESKLQSCGICLKFIHPTVNRGGWVRNKGRSDESHFNKVSFLGWLEENGKYRLVHGEAEQACHIDPVTGKTKPRTGVDDFTVIYSKALIETKAQVRLDNADYLPGFVKALTQHLRVATLRFTEDDIPF